MDAHEVVYPVAGAAYGFINIVRYSSRPDCMHHSDSMGGFDYIEVSSNPPHDGNLDILFPVPQPPQGYVFAREYSQVVDNIIRRQWGGVANVIPSLPLGCAIDTPFLVGDYPADWKDMGITKANWEDPAPGEDCLGRLFVHAYKGTTHGMAFRFRVFAAVRPV